MAKVYFRYSTVAAGKSLDLLKVAYNYKEQGRETILITSSIDDRTEVGEISSRVGLKAKALAVGTGDSILDKCIEYVENNIDVDLDSLACILVDEAQFLTSHHIEELCEIADEADVPVIAYGLKNDFKNELFPGSEALLVLADSIEEIKTTCSECNKKAIMSMRKVNGKAVFHGDQVDIGWDDKYVPVCRKHYLESKKMSEEVNHTWKGYRSY